MTEYLHLANAPDLHEAKRSGFPGDIAMEYHSPDTVATPPLR